MQVSTITENNNEAETEKIKLTRNFPSFLFSDARYELNGVEIDRIKNVRIISTLKLLTASCQSNTFGYYHFNEAFSGRSVQNKLKEVVYDVMIPLSIWFGFCDDYNSILQRINLTLINHDMINAVKRSPICESFAYTRLIALKISTSSAMHRELRSLLSA